MKKNLSVINYGVNLIKNGVDENNVKKTSKVTDVKVESGSLKSIIQDYIQLHDDDDVPFSC